MPSLSARATSLPVSSIRKLIPLADQAKQEGARVYHLNLGQPDVKSPEVMIQALQNWDQNPIPYAPSGGTPPYLKSLLSYYHGLGFTYLEIKHLVGTIAGSEAISMALFSVANPGDEIIVFEPFYPSYVTMARMFDISVIPIETRLEEGFHLPEQSVIESVITPKTKAILYSSPANPTGVVYTDDEIQELVDVVQKHNLFLIADEVYREYTFVDRPHTSLLSHMPHIPDQAILVDSLSKRYNLCGARLGVISSLNEVFLKSCMAYAMSRLSGGLIDQHIGSKLTEVPSSYTQSLQEEYRRRRDVLYEGLKTIEGVNVTLPEGAFYIMAELPVSDTEDFCTFLLRDFRDNNETVMLAPGYGFYCEPEKGKKQVRIAYVLETPLLERCVELLKKAILCYQSMR